MVEFAFVLPILLILLVGVICYGYVFTLQTAVTYAAQQGAQAAVAVDPTADDYMAAVQSAVRGAVEGSLDWLPDSIEGGLHSEDGMLTLEGNMATVTVTLGITAGSSPLMPQINIPPFGSVPPLPANLTGVAEVAL